MRKQLLKFIVNVGTVYLLSFIIDNIRVSDIPSLLCLGLVLLAVNLILKPILLLLTLPLNVLTLGLFSIVVSTWTLMISDSLINGVSLGGFWNAFLASAIILVFHHAIDKNK